MRRRRAGHYAIIWKFKARSLYCLERNQIKVLSDHSICMLKAANNTLRNKHVLINYCNMLMCQLFSTSAFSPYLISNCTEKILIMPKF